MNPLDAHQGAIAPALRTYDLGWLFRLTSVKRKKGKKERTSYLAFNIERYIGFGKKNLFAFSLCACVFVRYLTPLAFLPLCKHIHLIRNTMALLHKNLQRDRLYSMCFKSSWKLGTKTLSTPDAETCRKICVVYREDAVTQRVNQKWLSRFRLQNFSIQDVSRSFWLTEVNNNDKVKESIKTNLNSTIKMMANILEISKLNVENPSISTWLH